MARRPFWNMDNSRDFVQLFKTTVLLRVTVLHMSFWQQADMLRPFLGKRLGAVANIFCMVRDKESSATDTLKIEGHRFWRQSL